jgi:hypothetical protein
MSDLRSVIEWTPVARAQPVTQEYIGGDLHKSFFRVCALSATGERRWEGRVERTAEGVARFVARGVGAEQAVAVEASGPTRAFVDAFMLEQSSLAWPLARIDRANELLTHLDAALKGFLQKPPYVIEERPEPNPTTRAFVITKLHEVPPRPRIIAGEVAHHLRAALDLLAYQLLAKEGITDSKRLRDCAFPIITNRNLSKQEDKRKHDESIKAKVGGVSKVGPLRRSLFSRVSSTGSTSRVCTCQNRSMKSLPSQN